MDWLGGTWGEIKWILESLGSCRGVSACWQVCSRHSIRVRHQGHPGYVERGCPAIAWPGTFPPNGKWTGGHKTKGMLRVVWWEKVAPYVFFRVVIMVRLSVTVRVTFRVVKQGSFWKCLQPLRMGTTCAVLLYSDCLALDKVEEPKVPVEKLSGFTGKAAPVHGWWQPFPWSRRENRHVLHMGHLLQGKLVSPRSEKSCKKEKCPFCWVLNLFFQLLKEFSFKENFKVFF